MQFKPYAKAFIAGAIAFTGAVATGYADGTMQVGEWWLAASSGLVALGGVFGVPNKRVTRTRIENGGSAGNSTGDSLHFE